MISLRKHIDDFRKSEAAVPEARTTVAKARQADVPPAISAYTRTLQAMSESGQRAVPELGEELGRNLAQIQQSLAGSPVTATLGTASGQVEAELARWADQAWQRHVENEREIKEIISVVARASESVVERDKRYGDQIGDLNSKLRGLAKLDDLPVIRRSILESTRALRDCIEKMAEEGREQQRRMGGEVAEYKKRLAESERISRTDPLTKLANRRAFEQELDVRIVTGQAFCLILLDLNDFKSVNDTFGHAAGDDLLRQFGEELRTQFTPLDLVARWGGDEFVAICGGNRWDAESRTTGIRKWVLGDYKLDPGRSGGNAGDDSGSNSGSKERIKISIDASIGIVEWDRSETGGELLARADREVYAGKRSERRRGDRRTAD